MFADDEADLAKLIAEHKRLRKLLHDLDEQLADVEDRPVPVEHPSPADGADQATGDAPNR